MESIVVRMVKINKSFSGVRVLQDISFSLKEKEIHGLLGKIKDEVLTDSKKESSG
jgi:ABC-type sugar transport system ATPase subunit